MSINDNQEEEKAQPDFFISKAIIKDGFCHYSFINNVAPGKGDTLSVKGAHIVHDDLETSFTHFRPHLAIIDQIFYHAKVEFETIEEVKNHDFIFLYHVYGFDIKGAGTDDESIILYGSKSIAGNQRIELATPKIILDATSSYKWYNELKEVTQNVRNEVSAYKLGKYGYEEASQQEDNRFTQLKIFDASKEEQPPVLEINGDALINLAKNAKAKGRKPKKDNHEEEDPID
jgi:hypothetical protein